MSFIDQRPDRHFVIEELNINDVHQPAGNGQTVECEVRVIADLRFTSLFMAAEGEQQRYIGEQPANLRQRQQDLIPIADSGKMVDTPFDKIGSGLRQRAGMGFQLVERLAD